MTNHLINGISKRLKAIRQDQNLKLTEVADLAGISKGLLSKIENGRTVPSLPVLLSVIRALGFQLDDFFAELYFTSPQKYMHVKANEHVAFKKEEEAKGFHYNLIMSKAMDNFTIEAVILDIEPGAKRRKVQVDAFEFKYILEGEINYELDDEVVLLKKGDTLLYDGKIPHVPRNETDSIARMLVVYLYYNANNK